MKGEDKGEDLWIFTAETNNRTAVFIYLFIHLFIQQRVGNRYIGEVAGEYFFFFFFFQFRNNVKMKFESGDISEIIIAVF